jgi:hypothetical protein
MMRAAAAALVIALVWAHAAFAQAIEIKQFSLEPLEQVYALNADFDIELTSRLEEALNSGVPLSFVVEFELTRPRWYWFDQKTATGRLEARLSYNSLLRQYRLTTGPIQRNYSALSDAMAALARVRGWPAFERDRISPDTQYVASIRMRLDTAQLPKPFQITAITDRDWNLSSQWRSMNVTPAELDRR